MGLAILIIVIIFAIAFPLAMKEGKKTKQLYQEGKIIARDSRFAEKGEEFTSKIGTMENLKQKLEKMYLTCQMEGNTSNLKFTGSMFSAHLYKVDYDEPSGIAIYRFEFTSWKTQNGVYSDINGMNILMTSVEKVFLELDPNTGVKSYDMDFKTKHKLF